MSSLAVIETATIFRMTGDAELVRDIPCLIGKREIFNNKHSGGCGSCAQKKAAAQRDALNKIKVCLAGLGEENRKRLKNWLGVDSARVVYTNAAGKVVQVNF